MARACPYSPENTPGNDSAAGDDRSSGNYSASQHEYVDSLVITKFPYHSVGKLFWLTQDGMNITYYSTAFYIGDVKIVTAAHAFDLVEVEYKGKLIPKPSKAAMFVPAMTAKDDINGKHYGRYPIVGDPVSFSI